MNALITRLRGFFKPRLSILGEMISPLQWLANRRAKVFIISYPKTGRTWLRMLLKSALEEYTGIKASDPLELHELSNADPRIPRLRVIHDDEPHWKTPKQLRRNKAKYKNKKVILLIRDPRDTMVSLYLQMTKRWRVFLPEWKTREAYIWQERGALQSMIAYYNIWAQSRHLPGGLLLIRYEDIHANTATVLKKILAFMGINDISDAAIAKAIEQNQIEHIRAREQAGEFKTKRLQPGIQGDAESLKARKGKVGGWREYLSDSEGQKIAAYAAANLDPWYGYSVIDTSGTT